MTDCEHCHKEIKKDEDFILAGKYPSGWRKLRATLFPSQGSLTSPRDFGAIYHESCFLEMIKNEMLKNE